MKRSVKKAASREMSKTGLEKKKFQLILWVSSSHILLAWGHLLLLLVNDFVIGSMADPDLQKRGGPGDPEPELTRGWGVVSKKFFCPSSGLSLVYKQVGGGGVGLPLDPPLRMIHLELCPLGR